MMESSNKYTVMKFGGTSVDRMDAVGDLIEAGIGSGSVPVGVVSAFSGETNKFIQIAGSINQDFRKFERPSQVAAYFSEIINGTVERAGKLLERDQFPESEREGVLRSMEGYLRVKVLDFAREILDLYPDNSDDGRQDILIEDRVVGLGEIFAAYVLANMMTVRSSLKKVYTDINLNDVLKINKRIDGPIDQEKLYTQISSQIAKRIMGCVSRGELAIVTGYVGFVPGGILQTIDRGYTDSTAAMTARGLKNLDPAAHVKLEIWKEVDGLMSADPRIVGNTVKLRTKAHYDEAAELSDLAGMKAINPHGIWVLDGQGIQIHVRNTSKPEGPGTLISMEDDQEVDGVRFISGKKGQTTFRVSSSKMIEQKGVLARIFKPCADLGISVGAISTSARTVVFSVDSSSARNVALVDVLSGIGKVEIKDGMAIICCIGSNLNQQPMDLKTRLSGILAENGIRVDFDGGDGERNITFVIKEQDHDKAIRVLHKGIF